MNRHIPPTQNESLDVLSFTLCVCVCTWQVCTWADQKQERESVRATAMWLSNFYRRAPCQQPAHIQPALCMCESFLLEAILEQLFLKSYYSQSKRVASTGFKKMA